MFFLISKLNNYANKLDESFHPELADKIDKITSYLLNAYTPRIKRERKSRGVTRTRRKLYYRLHKSLTKRKQKLYRRKWKSQLKRRRYRKHYHRIG
jgi:hypothetical protein